MLTGPKQVEAAVHGCDSWPSVWTLSRRCRVKFCDVALSLASFLFFHDKVYWATLNLFQGNKIDSTNSLAYVPYKDKLSDDVTEVVTADQAGCQCVKAPPHCDCCAQLKVFGYPVKGKIFIIKDKDRGDITCIVHRLRTIRKIAALYFDGMIDGLSGLHTANLRWQTRVSKPKLVCVNGTKTGGKHVCKLLASNRNVFVDFFMPFTHTNLSLPTRVCQL